MTIQWSGKTLITCQTTKKQDWYLTVRIENKILLKAFFFLRTGLNKVRLTNSKRFVDLFIKMDDLHLSDFREMRLKSKGDYEIANSAVVSISFNDYLKKFIFSGQGFGCANFKADKSYISHLRNFIALTGNSALLRNVTIFHLITPCILFQ